MSLQGFSTLAIFSPVFLYISADDSGDEKGGRLRGSLLVIRSRRRSRRPILRFHNIHRTSDNTDVRTYGRVSDAYLIGETVASSSQRDHACGS